MKKFTLAAYLSIVSVFSSPVFADEQSDLLAIQQQWAVANYELKDDAQIKAFTQLSEQSAQFIENYPNSANSYTWNGIVLASFAGAKGGLGALGYAKDAKASLEQALKIDDSALGGSAYASLEPYTVKYQGGQLALVMMTPPISFLSKHSLLIKKALILITCMVSFYTTNVNISKPKPIC